MAKRKQVTTTTETSDTEIDTTPTTETVEDRQVAQDEADVLAELLALGGGGGVSYTVHKVRGGPGEQLGYCQTYSRDDLNLDAIRDQFGGGQFTITGRNSQKQYAGQRTIDIKPLPKPPTPAGTTAAEIAAALAANKPDPNGGIMPLILKMIESQGQLLTAILTKPAPASPAGPSFMEILQMIKEMQPKGGADDSVKVLLQGLQLGRELGGDGGEKGILDVAEKGLDMLAPLLAEKASAGQTQPAAGTQPARQPAAVTKQPAPGTVPAQPAAEKNPMLQKINWLRHQTKALVYQASRGKSAELYAEVMLDNLPEFITADEILQRIKPDDAVQTLAQLNGDVLKFVPWFEEFRKAVIEFLDTPPESGQQQTDDGALEDMA